MQSEIHCKLSDDFDVRSEDKYKRLFGTGCDSSEILDAHEEQSAQVAEDKIVVISESNKSRSKSKAPEYMNPSLSDKSVEDLRKLAKEHNLKNIRSLSKEKLINILQPFITQA